MEFHPAGGPPVVLGNSVLGTTLFNLFTHLNEGMDSLTVNYQTTPSREKS